VRGGCAEWAEDSAPAERPGRAERAGGSSYTGAVIEDELRRALADLVDGLPPRQAAGAVQRLIDSYRGATPTGAPVLRGRADAVAYAAYRMPATFGAVRAALAAFAERTPGWTPGSHLDVGGGTGAAVWAAESVWGGAGGRARTVRPTTVLDWAEPALALGRELAGAAGARLPGTTWQRRSLRADAERSSPLTEEADLVTLSYVLGELDEDDRRTAVDAAARAGQSVVVVEPGTPRGYERIIAARDQLTAAGLRVLAPCPHSDLCPIVPGDDWCHFAARVNRSSLHRRVKGGSLPYEDEKYSYVAAALPDVAGAPAPARIVRRPRLPKGQALLELCTVEEGLRAATVTKRHGSALYRAARDARWGEAWPPEEAASGEEA
jgi:ribosomal protein RSM22 (predicted rRNA methylase)